LIGGQGGYRRFGRYLLALAFAFAAAAAGAQSPALGARQYAEDFDTLWRAVDEGYAYFDRSGPAWKRSRDSWRPRAVRARSRDEFVAALEGVLSELRDDHASLSERSSGAPRRHAETDIWARWKDGAAVIEGVRTFGDADVAGLRPGQVVTRVQGIDVEQAVRARLGPGASGASERDRALRQVLAGPRSGTVRIEVRDAPRPLEMERAGNARANGPAIVARRVGDERDLGYVRIKNGADDARLVEQFDSALNSLKDTRALILDVRETPGPASRATTLAILARFLPAAAPWQAREARGGKRVVDVAAPRGAFAYGAPVVLLVDRWTEGEAEALAAGLKAAVHARLVGTPMAGLRGELREVRLPHTGIVVRFPAEKSLLPDGTPREALRPDIAIDLAAPSGGPGDPILYQALKLLEKGDGFHFPP
jgi:C-terminal processing protease CtpA/Prc